MVGLAGGDDKRKYSGHSVGMCGAVKQDKVKIGTIGEKIIF